MPEVVPLRATDAAPDSSPTMPPHVDETPALDEEDSNISSCSSDDGDGRDAAKHGASHGSGRAGVHSKVHQGIHVGSVVIEDLSSQINSDPKHPETITRPDKRGKRLRANDDLDDDAGIRVSPAGATVNDNQKGEPHRKDSLAGRQAVVEVQIAELGRLRSDVEEDQRALEQELLSLDLCERQLEFHQHKVEQLQTKIANRKERIDKVEKLHEAQHQALRSRRAKMVAEIESERLHKLGESVQPSAGVPRPEEFGEAEAAADASSLAAKEAESLLSTLQEATRAASTSLQGKKDLDQPESKPRHRRRRRGGKKRRRRQQAELAAEAGTGLAPSAPDYFGSTADDIAATEAKKQAAQAIAHARQEAMRRHEVEQRLEKEAARRAAEEVRRRQEQLEQAELEVARRRRQEAEARQRRQDMEEQRVTAEQQRLAEARAHALAHQQQQQQHAQHYGYPHFLQELFGGLPQQYQGSNVTRTSPAASPWDEEQQYQIEKLRQRQQQQRLFRQEQQEYEDESQSEESASEDDDEDDEQEQPSQRGSGRPVASSTFPIALSSTQIEALRARIKQQREEEQHQNLLARARSEREAQLRRRQQDEIRNREQAAARYAQQQRIRDQQRRRAAAAAADPYLGYASRPRQAQAPDPFRSLWYF